MTTDDAVKQIRQDLARKGVPSGHPEYLEVLKSGVKERLYIRNGVEPLKEYDLTQEKCQESRPSIAKNDQ